MPPIERFCASNKQAFELRDALREVVHEKGATFEKPHLTSEGDIIDNYAVGDESITLIATMSPRDEVVPIKRKADVFFSAPDEILCEVEARLAENELHAQTLQK